MFAVGFAAAFVSAFFCVRWLLRYIARHDFTVFAWYRIVFGVVVLVTAYTGLVSWTDARQRPMTQPSCVARTRRRLGSSRGFGNAQL